MDLPITALPSASIPLTGSEQVALVQGGTTKQAPVSALGGVVAYVASVQNTTSGCTLNVMNPATTPFMYAIDVVITIETLVTPDTMVITCAIPNTVDGLLLFDGPVNQVSPESGHNSFAASSTATPIVPNSGDTITLTYRCSASSGGNLSFGVDIGPAFAGTYNVQVAVRPLAPFSF